MIESLEKMLAKGVDNSLLRFGLGKGKTPRRRSISSDASNSIRSIRRRGNYWARPIWHWRTLRPRAKPGSKAWKPLAPMATSRPRRK